ncbi:two pore calcium channel protein 1-like isoform X2 [Oratosquilla oratoria]|uniref:two pore calcium channel protein 1-like isoform X2 n=1 Tax=Oratosquilla oratoria TaxID=337810 RepID=UPI003F772B4F
MATPNSLSTGGESFASIFLADETGSIAEDTVIEGGCLSDTTGENDIPNEYGNTSIESDSINYRELHEADQNVPQDQVTSKWEMNYHEASIFLEEGENNDKFNSHPRDRNALPAYLVVHNHWFYTLDLAASLLLMGLALIEPPAVPMFQHVPVGVHGSIELFGLAILGISILMQLRWLGWRTFIRHKRSVVKTSTWIIMLMEAIVVLVRNTTHFRITRAIRPIFLVDSRYLGGVRSYPDVMMPAYAKNRWSAAFFIAFLAINLYFIMNLMLAVIFVVFSNIEKDKFRKLLLHKRHACQYAFRLLVTRSQPNRITFRHFEGLMKFFKPKAGRWDVYLMFKTLNRSCSGLLSLGEFYNVYQVAGFTWRPKEPAKPWFDELPFPVRSLFYLIRKLVTWKWFDYFVYFVILMNGITLLTQTILLSSKGQPASHDLHVTWDQIAFVAFYVLEANLKLIGLGIQRYFHSGWNIYDFVVTILAVGGIIAEEFDSSFFYVVILRPLRLLRLFRMHKRYRDVFQTMVILLPRIMSAIVVIILTYYFFAIIGMELFAQYDMKNCCINTTVEQYYKDDNTTVFSNYYYLNNYGNLFMAGVTLFELTVVNNWFIIMEGYTAVTNDWSRLYFMFFYLVMMVVMSLVVAFIIEAFTFRMQYNQKVQESDEDEDNVHIEVSVVKEELSFMYSSATSYSALQQYATDLQNEGPVWYEGIRRRTKMLLQHRMYHDEIRQWLREAEEEDQRQRHDATFPRRFSSTSSRRSDYISTGGAASDPRSVSV